VKSAAPIGRERMFEPLIAACPSFAGRWQAFLDESEGRDPLYYVALGRFAHHLVERYQQGEIGDFPAIFAAIERLHVEGDAWVREAATIGLLEGIQNNSGNCGVEPGVFREWLLPETERWWNNLNGFWGGDGGPGR